MAGLFGVSIDPKIHKIGLGEDLFWGVFYHQHLGEQFAGLASWDQDRRHMVIRTARGLLRPNFDGRMKIFRGREGIGCCGSARQPFRFGSKFGIISLAITGNILNFRELIQKFNSQPGQTFEHYDETEVAAKLIAEGKNIIDGLCNLARSIKGAISLLLLTQDGIYGFYGPDGHWPLMIGEKNGAVAIASESAGFYNTGFKVSRDLKPGEIFLLRNGNVKFLQKVDAPNPKICSFLWVYTNFVASVVRDIPSTCVRMRLGSALARKDIQKGFIPHVVFPIPDSGRFHALGYYWEFIKQLMLGKIGRAPIYFELLAKYPYAGRSFTPQTKEERDREARAKILPSGEDLEGFILEYFAGLEKARTLEKTMDLVRPEDLDAVGCEDSIVRGTQLLGNFVPKLIGMGIKRVHIRASNPQLLSHCPWGQTTKKGEVIALRIPDLEERAKYLGLASLAYNTIGDLIRAIGLPEEELCMDCARSGGFEDDKVVT
ncbi:hypothetical protein KKC00_00205 [Patescibacteria group bacterium]|nr:hypothetical protein [Patescibacteria group bacterium]